ncbi:ArsR/SmtB family transcription factor [Actinomadura rifamycini]|uniref:ArsR/SmtB family transcription factor n=1 Tax=Actinomadura rifamycini TaxID=31962 RepID=UPI00047BF0FC|nr:metalloregulator ArsR/SmtB family transcription factor [Actinomadura rifamycini]
MPARVDDANAELFKTLAHPVRIRVLELLLDGPRQVGDLRRDVGVEASNLSHQLAVLRRSGLVTAAREDGSVTYELSAPDITDLLHASRRVLAALLNGRSGLLAELQGTQTS